MVLNDPKKRLPLGSLFLVVQMIALLGFYLP